MDPPMGNWGAPLANSGERRKVSPAGGCEGNWRSSAGPWLGRRGICQTPKARRLVPGMWEIQVSSGQKAGQTHKKGLASIHKKLSSPPAPTPPCPRSSLLSEAVSPGVLPNRGLGQGTWSPKFFLFYPNMCLSTGSWKGR